MTRLIKLFLLVVGVWLMAGCTKGYLDLQPRNQLTVPTTFANYKGFETYAWNFYSVFSGYNDSALQNEYDADLFEHAVPNGRSSWIWQLITVPSAAGSYTDAYARIRAVNIMLDNIDGSALTDADKKHWRSVGYFFRAYNYANLINMYGDVPYIDHSLADDAPELKIPRTPRDSVAMHILNDLAYAEINIKPDGDGPNTINTSVVEAFISRFGLREGTWRKYHQLGNANTYLQASMEASAKLMSTFPTLLPGYDMVFNSQSLAGAAGIILYKQYEINQITHNLSTINRNSSGRYDLTKKAVDMYLMKDGKTRFTSKLFQGDQSPYTEFKDRDLRLYYTVPPPYKVNSNAPSTEYTFTGNPQDTMYFGLMNQISGPDNKAQPTINWNGFVVKQEPHFADNSLGQAYCVTYTGYRFYKFSNRYILNIQGSDINDCPIFRMGEILLNYAEATYELGQFDQSVADATINKLRARGEVADLELSGISDDPTRDPEVPPVLWEIRRERAVELMGEGFRFDDLRRWKKMDYAVQRKLGRWITKGTDVPANSIIPILDNATEGYIAYEGQPPSPFPDYYYLYPIPSNEIVLNPEVVQNPGWKQSGK